jgi:hypothetical protein
LDVPFQGGADALLKLLDGITIEDYNDQVEHGNVRIAVRDGWWVVVFYDCGELDYIDHFVAPDGSVVDFWEWPDSDDRQRLIAWR